MLDKRIRDEREQKPHAKIIEKWRSKNGPKKASENLKIAFDFN